MRRSDRLFDVIQRLRTASRPVTAAALAAELEVTPRTVYRDIATLQARRVPIEGAAGVGYVLRKGFDLPPLMFTIDEVEAIAVGARLVKRLKDPALQQAADAVLAEIRAAIRDSRKLFIGYGDSQGRRTNRVIWPIAMAYYVDATLVGAWC